MKKKLPSPVTLLILTVLTIIVWVSLGVYRAFTTEAPPSVPAEVSQDLAPSLDRKVIEDIKTKQFINEIPILTPIATASPQPTQEATPTVSPTGENLSQ